jgi:hypothetical protein
LFGCLPDRLRIDPRELSVSLCVSCAALPASFDENAQVSSVASFVCRAGPFMVASGNAVMPFALVPDDMADSAAIRDLPTRCAIC